MSILDLAIQASNIKAEDINPGVLLYGDPGSGKTYGAVKGGKPLVLLLEHNGLTTIVRANPDADVILVNSVDQIRQTVLLAKAGGLREKGYDRLVIDSLTECQRFFKDEIAASREGGGSTESFSQSEWGVLTEKMRRFMRTLRALPFPVVATALSQASDAVVNGNRTVAYRPAFEGKKTASETAQYFNAVGFTVKRDIEGVAQHKVMFDGPSRYVTKSCGTVVSGIVEADCPAWLVAIADPSSDEREEEAQAAK